MIEEAISNGGENRFRSLTQKISRSQTGLNGSLFVHIDFSEDGFPVTISFSEKAKDDNALDRILAALGDAVTQILRETKRKA